jgi:WhiB family redox-sensing transcriptional regulator
MNKLYENMPNLEGANCVGLDTDLFYDDYIGTEGPEFHYYVSTKPKQHAQLRRICLECPVVQECREYAISHELYGFWGGMTAMERISERVVRGMPCLKV